MALERLKDPELRIVTLDKDVSIATHGQAVLCHFRGLTPASAAAILRRALGQLDARRPAIFFAVIETTSTPPDGEARAAFSKFFEDSAERLACAVVAIRGEGFRAAMVRTIASGILHLMPRFRVAFPKHIVASPEEAARLAKESLPALDTTALLHAFTAFSEMPAP